MTNVSGFRTQYLRCVYVHSVLIHFRIEIGKEPNKIDVVFLMGASNPSGNRHFLNEKRLVEEIVQRNSTPATRFAIIQYDYSAAIRRSLNDYTNPETFIVTLNSLYWRGDATNMQSGIEEAKVLFEKEGRPKARKILVVFSDGTLPANVEEIKRFKKPLGEQQVKIISVTVGDNVDEDKFNELSSKNDTIKHDDQEEPKDTGDKIEEEILKGMHFIFYDFRYLLVLPVCPRLLLLFTLLPLSDPCVVEQCGKRERCEAKPDDSILCGESKTFFYGDSQFLEHFLNNTNNGMIQFLYF